MKTSRMRIIKLIGRRDYEVEMLETYGGYLIRHEIRSEQREHYSELIKDFGTASYMFDLKLQDLEGN